MASVKNKKYGYRKETQFSLFAGSYCIPKKFKRSIWKTLGTNQLSKVAQIQTKQTKVQSFGI